MSTRIFLCCDDPLRGAGLSALLDRQPDFHIVGLSFTHEAATDVKMVSPDIVVVSVTDLSVAVHRELARAARVVTLVNVSVGWDPAEVLALGARAVLSSGVSPEELMLAIRVVAASDTTILLPLSIRQHIEAVSRTASAWERGTAAAQLTPRETDVLSLLAQGMSNAEVATALFVSVATVRSHVHHILRKLAVRSRAEAVAHAYKTGLIALAV
ncbi:MAG: response regulator transcription factor [Pseudonocardiales bacterium]|nr:response regulator transcription factor [Pseudonocardiales bacterium]